jgi:hypothetical protein
VTAAATILSVIASASAYGSSRVTETESTAPARRRTVFRAFAATVAVAAIVAVDLLARRRLPQGIGGLLPVLTFAVGIMVSRRLVGREHREASAIDTAKSRIDRAAVELESLSIGNRRPMAPERAIGSGVRYTRK